MLAAREAAIGAARAAGVPRYGDAITRAGAERDFGGLAEGRCLLVAEPRSPETCAHLLDALKQRGLACTVRGTGYGQAGQSVALDTVSLSTRRLDWIGELDPAAQTITVGAGATLRRVLEELRESGLAPPTLPLNLDMSIGGLLSAGGIGPASHRHGAVISNVTQLDVITGSGELRSCSRQRNADLFAGALGGLGQCGLITQATLALAPRPQRMKVHSLLYDDVRAWLEDQLIASDADIDVHIEGHCWATAKGLRSSPRGPEPYTHWMYGLHLACDAAAESASRNLVQSLRPLRVVDEHDADLASYVHRYEPRFAGMVQSGAWSEAHPWYEALVPLDRAEDVLVRVLAQLPAEAGDGHRFMMLDTRRLPPFFASPPGARVGVIGVFPVSLAKAALAKALDAVERATTLVLDAGGRRYLSGWLGRDGRSYLRAHFGDRYSRWLDLRRRCDAAGVFRSFLFPSGNGD